MPRKWRPSEIYRGTYSWHAVGNMYPNRLGQYVTAPVFGTVTGAGPATPGTSIKAWAALKVDGTAIGYVGTSTKIWSTTNFSAFTDRTKVGGYTATTWSFAQYGNFTVATNNSNPIQVRDATGGAAFADLGGSPPSTAKILVTQSNVLLAFNLNSGANCFAASDVGNHANWTTGDAVASTAITHRPGPITAAVAFKDVVIVFKSSSIYRLRYVGSPYKWTVELIADGNGVETMDAVISCGDVLFFVGLFGQFIFDGSTFRPADDGFNDPVDPVISPTAIDSSIYLPNEGAVWVTHFGATFDNGSNAFIYNRYSDRWGCLGFYNGGATQLTSYVPITGAPEAVSAIFGNNFASRVYVVDLALNPCVVVSTLRWGQHGGGNQASIEVDRVSKGQDVRTSYVGVVPRLVTYPYSLDQEAQLADFASSSSAVYSYDNATTGTAAVTQSLFAGSGSLNCNINTRYLGVLLQCNTKPFTLDDLKPIEAGDSEN